MKRPPTNIDERRANVMVENELARAAFAIPELEKDASVYLAMQTLIKAGIGPIIFSYFFGSMARPCTARPGRKHPAACACRGSDYVWPWKEDPPHVQAFMDANEAVRQRTGKPVDVAALLEQAHGALVNIADAAYTVHDAAGLEGLILRLAAALGKEGPHAHQA